MAVILEKESYQELTLKTLDAARPYSLKKKKCLFYFYLMLLCCVAHLSHDIPQHPSGFFCIIFF